MSKEKIIGTKHNCLFQCLLPEKNRREKVRKQRDYLTEERRLRGIFHHAYDKYISVNGKVKW